MAKVSRQPIALLSMLADPTESLTVGKTRPEVFYLRQMAEALAKLGWQVDVFTIQPTATMAEVVDFGEYCRFIRLPAPQAFAPQLDAWAKTIAAFEKYHAKGGNYPLVHSSDWLSGWLGLQLKQRHHMRMVHTAYALPQAMRSQGFSDVPLAQQSEIEAQIWQQADQVVVTIPWQPGQAPWPYHPARPAQLIPCGTDTRRFHLYPKAEARTKLRMGPDESVLLYVGQFAPHKGLDTLVGAAQQLQAAGHSFRLLLVGDDMVGTHGERARIQQLVKQVGLAAQIDCLGYVPQEQLPTYYAAADLCVIPSNYEPFGWVAIEAMACGTPVVASEVGGLKLTILHEETGLLVPPRDAVALAEAIERMLDNPEWAANLRQPSLKRAVEYFSWTRVAAQMSDLYRRLFAEMLMGASLAAIEPPQQPAAA